VTINIAGETGELIISTAKGGDVVPDVVLEIAPKEFEPVEQQQSSEQAKAES
jgi:hypothetical protein